ncbi:MAG: hypothetical protein HFI70_04255 [Lachnospiraceae bacterium]|nr:hypothetical protein [Lachnospiraceae bacterium]
MNEVIKALYEIEEQAGELMDKANISRQTMQEEKKRQMEEISAELEAEMEGRLAILKSRLEEQAKEQIQKLEEKSSQKIIQLNEMYQKNLHQYAREIVERITEV